MIHLLVIVLSTILGATTYAATGSQLDLDIQLWTDVDAQHDLDETIEDIDEVFQEADVLFPAGNSETSGGQVDPFISARIDGRVVVLQDVPTSSWFAPYVRDIAERGIVSGYRDAAGMPTGYFGPADSVTLEQLAKVAAISSGRIAQGCDQQTINLTASGGWAAQYVGCAEKLQWSVFSDGTVDVQRKATRSEVIATILESFSVKISDPQGGAFLDVHNTSQFASAIEQAKKDGIVSGYTDEHGVPTNMFGPTDVVNRAEFAKIVTLSLQTYSIAN